MDEVWFVFFGVGVIFLHWYRKVLLIFLRPIHGVIEMFGSLFLSFVLHG